jgi:hypothetical protein
MDPLLVLKHISDPLATPEQRRAAEAWCSSDEAWGWCAAVVSAAPDAAAGGAGQQQQQQQQQEQVQLLAAQILHHKLASQGWALPAAQLAQLRGLLLSRLRAAPPSGPLLAELLLCLAAAYFLTPEWADAVGPACAAMDGPRVARFLQLLAEEAGGDLRRVHHGAAGAEGAARARRGGWEGGGDGGRRSLRVGLAAAACACARASAGRNRMPVHGGREAGCPVRAQPRRARLGRPPLYPRGRLQSARRRRWSGRSASRRACCLAASRRRR